LKSLRSLFSKITLVFPKLTNRKELLNYSLFHIDLDATILNRDSVKRTYTQPADIKFSNYIL